MKTPKLSDMDKVEIRAAYAEGGVTYRDLAAKYHCSYTTIKRVLQATPEEDMVQLAKDIHAANAANMLEHIKNRNVQAMGLFDQILDTLQAKIPNASARELFGGLKILSEIFTPQAQTGTGDGSEAVKINVIFGDTSGMEKPTEAPDQISEEEAQSYAE